MRNIFQEGENLQTLVARCRKNYQYKAVVTVTRTIKNSQNICKERFILHVTTAYLQRVFNTLKD